MLSDLDVIKHVKSRAEGDAKFFGRTDREYKAFVKGQEVGAERAMAHLRQLQILKSRVIEGNNLLRV